MKGNNDTLHTPLHLGRAYKLGKKRWSYNQFEIRVQNEIGANVLDVKEALQSSTPPSLQHLSVRACIISTTNSETLCEHTHRSRVPATRFGW